MLASTSCNKATCKKIDFVQCGLDSLLSFQRVNCVRKDEVSDSMIFKHWFLRLYLLKGALQNDATKVDRASVRLKLSNHIRKLSVATKVYAANKVAPFE